MCSTPRPQTGFLYASIAFVIWGLFPLYFLLIPTVSPVEVVLQRSLWALVFLALILTARGQWAWLLPFWAQPRRLLLFGFSALLLAGNWLTYVHAIQTHRVIEASLGYFINPLLSVLLGVVVLGERLNRAQRVAVALAAAGVAWLTWQVGQLPWIALVLAGSFAVYGLVRKTSALGPLEGLALETLLLAPWLLPALWWWTTHYNGVWARGDWVQSGWLVLSGPLSALPLLCFAMGARRLPLATIGLMQYLSPTIQLGLGIWVFHEPFDSDRLVGFVCIWSALLLTSADALRKRVGASAVSVPDQVVKR